MSSKRKYLAIALIFLISGFFLGNNFGYSDPPTPTLDPDVGIWDFLWVNSTVGVNTPQYYRNGQNFTEWVESISGGGTSDHGVLTGLEDDDHGQYLLQDGSEGLTGDWDVGNYDINAKDMTADEFYRTGLGNYTAWIESISGGGTSKYNASGATAILGFDTQKEARYSNYFLCDGSSDGATIQEAIDYYEAVGGGYLYWEAGIYDVSDQDITLPTMDNNWVGEGKASSVYYPTTSGGTVIHLSDDNIIKDNGASWGTEFSPTHLSFYFSGDFTVDDRGPIHCPYTVPTFIDVGINQAQTMSTGAYAPDEAGVFFGSPGPPARTFTFKDCIVRDARHGGNESWAIFLYGESVLVEGTSWVAQGWTTWEESPPQCVNARMIHFYAVSFTSVKNFVIYTTNGAGWDGADRAYQWQFAGGLGSSQDWYLENVQWIDDDDITSGHIQVGSGGGLYVHIKTLKRMEGGTTPVLPSFTGSGTVYFLGSGWGYEDHGTAEASNTDPISFTRTFVATPTTVVVTVNEYDARYIAQACNITTTGFDLLLWDDTAGELETADKTISYTAYYDPSG